MVSIYIEIRSSMDKVSLKPIVVDALAPQVATLGQTSHVYHVVNTTPLLYQNATQSLYLEYTLINVILIYIKYIGYSILMACFQITLIDDAFIVPLFTTLPFTGHRESSDHTRRDLEDIWRTWGVQASTSEDAHRNIAVV